MPKDRQWRGIHYPDPIRGYGARMIYMNQFAVNFDQTISIDRFTELGQTISINQFAELAQTISICDSCWLSDSGAFF